MSPARDPASAVVDPTASLSESQAGNLGASGRRRSGPGNVFAALLMLWLIALGVSAVVGPLLMGDSLKIGVVPRFASPSLEFPFGGDQIGRDMLARMLHGTRTTVGIAAVSIGSALIMGGLFGLLAGYFGGKTDLVVSIAVDTILSFPGLVLALALASFLGPSARNVAIAIGFVATPSFARLVRAHTLSVGSRPYVTASRAAGAKDSTIICREILPNVIPSAIAFSLIAMGIAVLIESSLGFLGLGVPLPTPSWGGMLQEGRRFLDEAPHIAFFPASFLFITILALNYLGERAGQEFDVREAVL